MLGARRRPRARPRRTATVAALAALNPKPVDLTVHVGLHPDAQLYDWITNGIPGTAMPAWRSDRTDQQRWDVINYLRTLSR